MADSTHNVVHELLPGPGTARTGSTLQSDAVGPQDDVSQKEIELEVQKEIKLEVQKLVVQPDEQPTNWLKGTRLLIIEAALCLTMFLTNLEIPIVSTALVTITDDLSGFGKSSWIVAAYLITFIGFLIIWGKLSDIYGRKPLFLLSILSFAVFSGLCGAAKSINTLIVFRALQGIGGSGIYSIGVIILFDLVPRSKFPMNTAIISVTFALSLALGPILGGVIDDSSAWRWVFLLNVPVSAITGVILFLSIPNKFPYHGDLVASQRKALERASHSSIKRVDFMGAFLLLTATVLLITGIEQAGTQSHWRSADVISLLTISGIVWILVFCWSRYTTVANGIVEPIFPWRFVQSRVCVGLLLTGFCLGGPFTVGVFQIPQRYQVVNGLTPLNAGVRLLPFSFLCPSSSAIMVTIIGKTKIPPIYFVVAGSILQIVGFGLLTTLPNSSSIPGVQYLYEVIAGIGTGTNAGVLNLMTPFSVPPQDRAVGLSSFNQIRFMGGAIVLAIVSNVLNSYVQSSSGLGNILSPAQIAQVQSNSAVIKTFAPEIQEQIRSVFGKGYNLQMKILVGLAAGQLPSALFMWQKKQLII